MNETVTGNRYLQFHEKSRLVKMLVSGKTGKKEFYDSRNKMNRANMESFISQYPAGMRTAAWFLYYLGECGVLEVCGGPRYVEDIFRGVGGGHEEIR